jgi:cold-inducible RNA-binding protein
MNAKLHVGNVSPDTTEAQLRELFSQAGVVKSVALALDRVTHTPRGFAFVEMGTADEAAKAIRLLNGQKVAGYTLKVSEARPREGDTQGGFDRGRSHRGRSG